MCQARLVLDSLMACLSHFTLASCPHNFSRSPPLQDMLFKYKLINPEPTPSNTSVIRLSPSRSLFPCPNHPKADTRQQGPMPQSPLKFSKLANLKPAYLHCPILPACENHNTGSCPQFLLSLCLLTEPGASLCKPLQCGVHFFSWNL